MSDPITIDTVARALFVAWRSPERRGLPRAHAQMFDAGLEVAWDWMKDDERDRWRAAAREAIRLHESGELAALDPDPEGED